jgi:hypothetical protein
MRILIGVVAALVATASVATAGPPSVDRFAFEFPYVDTWTCPGTPLDADFAVQGVDTTFSATKEQVHLRGVTTFAANGKTVSSNFHVLISIDPTTTVQTISGTVYNIQVPGLGTVLLDAGTITVDVSTNPPTVLHIGGPHQQFSGDLAALCTYLGA